MHFVFMLFFLFAGVIWGSWRDWKKYYSTILFFILCDMFAQVITSNHPLWRYQETFFARDILSNHTIISLLVMFIVYPATTLIYLGNFPKANVKKVLWILFWIFLYWGTEYINLHYLHLIRHENGWTMAWSLIFNIVMFNTIWIHYRNPIYAWIIAIIWSIMLILFFQIPVSNVP